MSSSLVSSSSSSIGAEQVSVCGKYQRCLQLSREPIRYYSAGGVRGWRITIVAEHGQYVENEIFMHFRQPVDAATGLRTDAFSHVGSPEDLAEFPKNAPLSDRDPPMFRKAYLDKVVYRLDEAVQLWTDVQVDVQGLIETLDFQDDLIVLADEWLGG